MMNIMIGGFVGVDLEITFAEEVGWRIPLLKMVMGGKKWLMEVGDGDDMPYLAVPCRHPYE